MNNLVTDNFALTESWQSIASDEAEVKITSEPGAFGNALRLDFDFKGGGGFVVARNVLAMSMPESYAFSFRLIAARRRKIRGLLRNRRARLLRAGHRMHRAEISRNLLLCIDQVRRRAVPQHERARQDAVLISSGAFCSPCTDAPCRPLNQARQGYAPWQ